MLPDLDQSGAWAHVHVSVHGIIGTKKERNDTLSEKLDSDPHCFTSRLISPRRLDDLTNYTVFLVPAFERGRLAGLGLPAVEMVDGEKKEIDALEKAWPHGTDKLVQLPVYYMWSFRTGPHGDFEYLVTLLKPYEIGLDAGIGFKKMDVSHPGLGLPVASQDPMDMDGALISTEGAKPWAAKFDFIQELVKILDYPDDYLKGDTPQSVVAPPIYGSIHAGRNRLPAPKTDKPEEPPEEDRKWLWRINVDPVRRAAASLGAKVVQANQQQLMASAWKQVDAIRRANREIRFGQLSMEVSASSYSRNILSQDLDSALFITAPLHNRVKASVPTSASAMPATSCPLTITAGCRIRTSPIVRGTLEPQWRKRACPLGALGRRQDRAEQDAKQVFLERMAGGILASSCPPEPVSSNVSFSSIDQNIIRSPLKRIMPEKEGEGAGKTKTAPSPIDAVLAAFKPELEAVHLGEFQDEELDGLRESIVADLEPRRNIAGSIRKRITLPPEPELQPEDPDRPRVRLKSAPDPMDETNLQPIMQAPEFPQPIYEALRDLSQDWLLPGVEKLPENSISLLMANQIFIEAFMVGLNHEMARELLWKGYPTDQKGTCFRQFWNSVGVISDTEISLEDQKDIKLITQWNNSDLGKNTSRKLTNGDSLVLLIRGELLKRYPNTIVYAAEADKDGEAWKIGSKEKHPIFSGTLKPDISFFGFDLTREEAVKGNGWFFVLQEQPSEPRFGLDVTSEGSEGKKLQSWDEFSWGHLADSADALKNLVYIDINASWPDIDLEEEDKKLGLIWTDGGSPDIARITFQPPARIAVHATRMLPND